MLKEMEIVKRLSQAIEELNKVNENLRELHLIREKRESKKVMEERIKRLEMSEEEYEEYLNSDENEVNISELVMDKGLYFELTEAYIKRDKLMIEIEELKELSYRSLNKSFEKLERTIENSSGKMERMTLDFKEFSKNLNNYL